MVFFVKQIDRYLTFTDKYDGRLGKLHLIEVKNLRKTRNRRVRERNERERAKMIDGIASITCILLNIVRYNGFIYFVVKCIY